jgi:hemolysin-activating ACP:hemolysin acyltransferase
MVDNTYTSGGLKFFIPLISPFGNTVKVKTELGATVFLRNSFSNPFRKK